MQYANKNLVTSEIAGLWNTYQNDSLSICVLRHFLSNVDDQKTKLIIEDAVRIAQQHINDIQVIFNDEHIPVPGAYNDEDVKFNAPRLFTDSFYLFYLSNMSGFGIDAYSVVLRYAARPDIIDFFIRCIKEALELYRKVTDLQLQQGTFISAPRVDVDKEITYIEKKRFFKGLAREPRPLIAREATNIFSGILIDIFWRAMCIAFGQTASLPRVKEFMLKGRDMASAHYKKFSEYLTKEHLPVPSFSESFVTDSTVSTYSDRLMVQHIIMLCNFAISVDQIAVISSLRSDLTALHTRFGAEIFNYISEGMDLLIEENWMEQPPQVIRHENLAKI